MHKCLLWMVLAVSAVPAWAAEKRFDFSEAPLNQSPTGCVSTVAGTGKPGSWKVLLDDFAVGTNASQIIKKSVVAQVAEDFTDEHFPMLVLGNDTYDNFTFTTRFKIVSGIIERMAGIAFRLQDEKNFYVVRASALSGTFYFYKVENGERGPLIGNKIPISTGVWHDLEIQCEGNKIHFMLDGKEAMPTLTDNTFSSGRIAYWTKSDSVSYFADTKVVYVPHERAAQMIVRNVMAKYPRLLGVKVFMMSGTPLEPRVVASDNENEIGQPGSKSDCDVISNGTIYYDKQPDAVVVTMPLRDRNGDSIAAVRVKMKTFKGQTEENAVVRAAPVVRKMQEQIPVSGGLND